MKLLYRATAEGQVAFYVPIRVYVPDQPEVPGELGPFGSEGEAITRATAAARGVLHLVEADE
jgi:hypothetical protein